MDNSIAADEVARRLQDESDDLFVLDVRNEAEFAEWQIPGSTNLPVYDDLLEGEFSTLEAHLDELPEDRDIAVVCVAGVTSAEAAAVLQDHGFDAMSVDDGMNGWGRVHRAYEAEHTDGIVQIVRPGTGCLSYLVHDGEEAVVVDPSQYVDVYTAAAAQRGLDIAGVADTHAHADHISGGPAIAAEHDVPYYLHEADAGDRSDVTTLVDGDTITVGNRELDVRYTPGHTPGSVSFQFGDALLSGDTLFLRSVGRPDLEDSDEDAVRTAASELFDSLNGLLGLQDGTTVLPGHFTDETYRPLQTDLGALRDETTNELFSYVAERSSAASQTGSDDADDGNRTVFVETIVESLADEPANYNEIKQINWGNEQAGEEAEALELGPNNCAAN